MNYSKNKIEEDVAKLAGLLDSKIANWIEKYQDSENVQVFVKEALKDLKTDFRGLAKTTRDQIEIKLLQMQLDSINKKISELEQAREEREHSSS